MIKYIDIENQWIFKDFIKSRIPINFKGKLKSELNMNNLEEYSQELIKEFEN